MITTERMQKGIQEYPVKIIRLKNTAKIDIEATMTYSNFFVYLNNRYNSGAAVTMPPTFW
ncbi:MAG: hypothetical protein JSW00_16690 [Thermoplasmata archaeon]|nr:MAG: hypothetical protein JSW00_16690 [Thermoplasmata archaeon]